MNDRPSDRDIVVLSGARTPFGDFGGALKDLDAVELAVHASHGALARGRVGPDQVDHVVMGHVIQASGSEAYLARHVGLKVGCPIGVPALTVNRLCGSGLQAIVTAAQLIKLGEAEVVLAGGTESMSQQPHIIRGARWGLRFREGQLEDNLWLALTDSYNNLPMAITAENLAARHGISRKEADDFAYVSHMRAASAEERGYLAEINEAFSAQYLAVERELGLDREKSNVNGGAVALGHPVGASGARLALTVLHELKRRQGRYALASLCIGGGQGIAMVFEALDE